MLARTLKWSLPVVIVAASLWAGRTIIANKPVADTVPPGETPIPVAATRVHPVDYRVVVRSEGAVRPRTESTLIPQVSGGIEEISASFREGGFFEAGELLVRIDPKDYELALATAEAQVAQAEPALEQELAQAKVVENDWKMLGKEAPGLGLRRPQIAAARAALLSARAQLERAREDLARTRIRAPYAGRVLEQAVDVGQFVSPGTVLARIYATDYVEIRLPLSNRQLGFVRLPERYRGDEGPLEPGPPVTLTATVGDTSWQWEGRVVRTEGAIDTASRQLFVVAQVDDPYGRRADGRPPLRIGQFVEAEIEGRVIEGAFVLPRGALREGTALLIVGGDGRLERRDVTVVWTDRRDAVVKAGLEPGEVVATTPLAIAAAGTLVAATIDGEAPEGRAAKREDSARPGLAGGGRKP